MREFYFDSLSFFGYTLLFLFPPLLSTTTRFAYTHTHTHTHTQWMSAVSNDVLVASGWLVAKCR